MARVILNLDGPSSDKLWPLVESTAYLFENVLGVDVVAAVDAHPDATPAQAAQDRPRRDDTPSGGGTDRQDAPDAAETHTRAALAAIHDARTTGGQQGTTYALTAIAHALLARTENP